MRVGRRGYLRVRRASIRLLGDGSAFEFLAHFSPAEGSRRRVELHKNWRNISRERSTRYEIGKLREGSTEVRY